MVAEGVFTTGRTTSYCSVTEVEQLLAGYDLGDQLGPEALRDRISGLLAASREAVERYAGRDFMWHERDEIWLDGSGTERLMLGEAGVRPPAVVHTVTVGEEELSEGEWAAYPQLGMLRLRSKARLRVFPAGILNVRVVVSWGFEAVPEAVRIAQAKLTAAEILGAAGGEAGEVTATRIGDYAVTYGRDGRYATAVCRLCSEAKEALASYRVMRLRAV